MSFKEFIEAKPLFCKTIDYSRMPRIWNKIKEKFKLPKIIHIIGTNAKGTTGRYLSSMLYKNDLSVGHYSSPHILEFNERIWKNGYNATDEELEKAHIFLQSIIESQDLKSLSYFEYTTLIAVYLFQNCDYAIFEAGMGGEYDATSVFDNDLSIITPIGLDHQEFLGNTIEEIALTKLRSIKQYAIIGRQKDKKIYKIALELSKRRKFKLYNYYLFLNEQTENMIQEYANKYSLPLFLKENLSLATSAYIFLGYKLKKNIFEEIKVLGRCQKIAKNITVDVGHNILAAEALRDHFMGKKVILIYNSYKDKDYIGILKRLKPVVKRVEILRIENNTRMENEDILKQNILNLGMEVSFFNKLSKGNEYLVFGSFSVVEKFIKDTFEK